MARSVGRQGPAAACLVTVGSSCRKNPCLHTGSWASSCFRTSWGLSAAEEGGEELHMQGGAGDKRAQLLLGEALQDLSRTQFPPLPVLPRPWIPTSTVDSSRHVEWRLRWAGECGPV